MERKLRGLAVVLLLSDAHAGTHGDRLEARPVWLVCVPLAHTTAGSLPN